MLPIRASSTSPAGPFEEGSQQAAAQVIPVARSLRSRAAAPRVVKPKQGKGSYRRKGRFQARAIDAGQDAECPFVARQERARSPRIKPAASGAAPGLAIDSSRQRPAGEQSADGRAMGSWKRQASDGLQASCTLQ